MIKSKGYGVQKAKGELQPFEFERRDIGPTDVLLDILYCGICHSDIHQVNNEWKESAYPMVPGHEIVGRVARVGADVTKFKQGDNVGVGCMVYSCRECESCKDGEEQYCKNGPVYTYNSEEPVIGGNTYGGYSNNIVVNQDFGLKIPDGMDLAATAPLLCAGITTYSPMRHWKVGKGQKVGVVGLGGLGHMAVKLAKSFGARVVVFTTSPEKVSDAKRLGADEVVLSKNAKEMEAHADSFDFILDTVSAPHDVNRYLSLLNRNGNFVIVGLPIKPHEVVPNLLISERRTLAGSEIGGIKETQEMLDYCAKHGIKADIEVVPIQKVNEAYERTLKSDVKYRFVIDLSSLPK